MQARIHTIALTESFHFTNVCSVTIFTHPHIYDIILTCYILTFTRNDFLFLLLLFYILNRFYFYFLLNCFWRDFKVIPSGKDGTKLTKKFVDAKLGRMLLWLKSIFVPLRCFVKNSVSLLLPLRTVWGPTEGYRWITYLICWHVHPKRSLLVH